MKVRNVVVLFFFLFSNQLAEAQIKLPQVLKQAVNSIRPGNPSQAEIGSALKEALELGISTGSDRLSVQDGFFGNAAVKLLFPPEVQKVEKTLRGLGLNKQCDDFILSLNRAAELAAKEAKPIFISALKQMSLQDAAGILLGKEPNAATAYFQHAASDALRAKFKPVIEGTLAKADATRYWTDLSTSYNKIPFIGKVNTDLTSYATEKAMEGLFHEIEQEELKIRQNPTLRSTALLQKVFAYADKNRAN